MMGQSESDSEELAELEREEYHRGGDELRGQDSGGYV
jgi:hypothetical protein